MNHHQLQLNVTGARSLDIHVEDTALKQVYSCVFSGFQIDSALMWESHIESLCSNLSWTLPPEVVRSCYYASVRALAAAIRR